MAVHCIIIDKLKDIDAVKISLDEHYPKNYKYHSTDQVAFINTEDFTQDVAENLGFKKDGGKGHVSGAVFKMNSGYAGFTQGNIWEWLADATR